MSFRDPPAKLDHFMLQLGCMETKNWSEMTSVRDCLSQHVRLKQAVHVRWRFRSHPLLGRGV